MIDFDKYLYSTGTHYISNSGKDENSGTKGGRAGDQTGHEWELRSWYSRYVFAPECVIGYTSKGDKFYFDYQDFDLISRNSWCTDKDGYLTAGSGSKGTAIRLHNLIMGKPEKGYVIDHINHNPNDNRRCNLRVVPLCFNNANSGIRATNKSGTTGICWETSRKRWRVVIGSMNRTIFIGRFKSLDDAIRARKAAEKEYFGMFAYDVSSTLVPPIAEAL